MVLYKGRAKENNEMMIYKKQDKRTKEGFRFIDNSTGITVYEFEFPEIIAFHKVHKLPLIIQTV